MTILIDSSVACNFKCKYCYNQLLRAKGNEKTPDLPAIEKTVRKLYANRESSVVLHGGEPLFLDRDVLKNLLKISYDISGRSALQSNGSLIDDEIIELFKQYKTSVGISIDGYYPANELRCDKKMTQRIIENIRRLHDEKISVAIIIVLSKANALQGRIKYVKKLLEDMDAIRVSSKINICSCSDPKIELTTKEAIWGYLELFAFCIEKGIPATPFTYIRNLLLGEGSADCIFGKPCDPYSTMSGIVVCGDGRISTCTKFTTERLEWTPHTDWRWDILKETDCKGCKYAGVVCSGGCPASAKDGDFRNKTKWCAMYKAMYENVEKILRYTHPGKSLSIDKTNEEKGQRGGESPWVHTDGNMTHRDHMDAPGSEGHTDGNEHIDGNTRHLDSNGSFRSDPNKGGDMGHADRPHGDYAKHGDSG